MNWTHATMRTFCATALIRGLLALLTVVAAFAFQARVGGMLDLPMVGMAGTARANMIQMGGHASGAAQHVRTSPQPPRAPDRSSQESHNHAAHCLFCMTGAFALEAGVLPLPTAPPRFAPQPQFYALTDLPAAPRHADARAPPVLL